MPCPAIRLARHGFRGSAFLLALTGWLGAFGNSAGHALQYQRVPLNSPPAVLIALRGPIIPGDFQRFIKFLEAMPRTDRIAGLALHSQGGNVFEAETMAAAIKKLDIATFVAEGGECSSACFLLFAAGTRRVVRADALIGVHSVSENGKETMGSMALTTAMARDLAELGVPYAIIGKLVQTPPGRATWLTPSDFASMGVTVLDPATSSPSREDPSPPVKPLPQLFGSPSPIPSAPPDQPATSKANEQGLADRRAWESWFAALGGAFKEGAEYWAGERSSPRPGSCYGPSGQNLGDWTAGCLAAKRILAPADIRRKSEPDYRVGWSSY